MWSVSDIVPMIPMVLLFEGNNDLNHTGEGKILSGKINFGINSAPGKILASSLKTGVKILSPQGLRKEKENSARSAEEIFGLCFLSLTR